MAEADQSSTPQLMTSDVTPPEGVVSNTTTQEVPTTQLMMSNITTPEVPTPAKKPRKPRPPKIVAKLATVTETSPTSGADVELRPSKEPELPLEFWAGLMQTQKVIMAKRKSDHYNSFRIV